jgi:hypothetical protein
VHLNPVRAHLLKPDERLLAYPWSSFTFYLAAPEHRPQWIRVERLLGEHGIQQDTAAGRQQFEQRMEHRRSEQADQEGLKAFRRGWCIGSEPFRSQMLEKMEGQLGEHHSGQLHSENAEAKAQRIIDEEFKRLGWKETDLLVRRKSDPAKLEISARLRKEPTLSLKAIAQRMHLGTSKSANARLHIAGCMEARRQAEEYQQFKAVRSDWCLGWIAERLHMGTRTHLAHLLYWRDKSKPSPPSPPLQPIIALPP